MNFKQYLLEQNEERRVDVTIKLYPKPNAGIEDFIYDGDSYSALSYLKHDVIDDLQENFDGSFFNFIVSSEQREINRSESDELLFSVIPSDHMIKYSDEDLKGEVYIDTKEILKSLKIKHEIILQDQTDRMRQSLKPETEKTFGGMLDEL